MYKLFAALSTVEIAHQKALTTRKAWLGERVHAAEASRAYPWNTFRVPSEGVITSSRSRLLDDLAELAEGTTIIGRPERTPPRFGPIASPESGSAKQRASQQLYNPPSPTPGVGYDHTEIVRQIPIAPIPLLDRAFEIREFKTPLSEPLSAFCDSFDENRPESPDTSDSDENTPPLSLFREEPVATDVEIPKPQLRGRREPFGVLHFDLEGAPSEDSLIIDADNLEDGGGDCKLMGVFYEGANVASGYYLRGWDRLRSKAPWAINFDARLKHEESTGSGGFRDLEYGEIDTPSGAFNQPTKRPEAPSAPKMTNVPLPPEISAFYASLSLEDNNLEDVATLISQKKFSPQMNSCRESLLAILNEGSKP